jgi:hypothetical protein
MKNCQSHNSLQADAKLESARSRIRIIKFLIFVFTFNSFFGFTPALREVKAQNKPIVVTSDQPNLWTLEQAHYLLAQMHRRNLDLKAAGVGALDANDINGVRFDVLKELLEIGANFDQAAGFNNNLITQDKTFNAERRRELVRRRDKLQDESLELTREIARLKRELERAETDEEKARLNTEIDEKTAVQAAVDKQIKLIDDELKNLNAATGNLTSVQAGGSFDASKFGSGTLDGAFKKATEEALKEFSSSPKLNASLRLDNYLQLQYEIISKQLTLLRDEVGPGERLVFLELPQSINTSFDKADQKWAQSWWRIAGYTRNNRASTQSSNDNSEVITTSEKLNSILKKEAYPEEKRSSNNLNQQEEFVSLDSIAPISGLERMNIQDRRVRTVELIPRQSSINVNDIKLKSKAGALNIVASFLFGFGAKLNFQRQREQFSQFVQQELYSSAFGKGSREFGWTFTPMPGTDRLLAGVRTTYAVVVVPQEATSVVLEATGCYFPRSAKQPGSFEETKDKERWQNEDLQRQQCFQSKGFILPIPGSGGKANSNDFYVERVEYQPVPVNGQIVVSIRGDNFSAQMGVLINGIPLRQSLGLAQPFIRDDSTTGRETSTEFEKKKIQGTFERVDSNQIVLTFEMPKDFAGTPIITLISPGKSLDLNRLTNLRINNLFDASLKPAGCRQKKLVPVAPWMFGTKPKTESLKVEKVEIFKPEKDSASLIALIAGTGFKKPAIDVDPCDEKEVPNTVKTIDKIFINGQVFETNDEKKINIVSSKLIKVEFPAPLEETVKITLTAGDDAIDVAGVKNPAVAPSAKKEDPTTNLAYLRIDDVEFVNYEGGILVVEIKGTGFTQKLKTFINDTAIDATTGELVVISPRRAIVKIINPGPAVTLKLVDEKTNTFASTIITRNLPLNEDDDY